MRGFSVSLVLVMAGCGSGSADTYLSRLDLPSGVDAKAP